MSDLSFGSRHHLDGWSLSIRKEYSIPPFKVFRLEEIFHHSDHPKSVVQDDPLHLASKKCIFESGFQNCCRGRIE
ncbi:ORF200 [White spot syndrome virus]|uniref:ORF200 n=1 Tax=White spot syndrome virus TaxID=342409 RepID=A0A2D3I682_9VIRU|nr:ORF200 [White spot syndrome virus]